MDVVRDREELEVLDWGTRAEIWASLSVLCCCTFVCKYKRHLHPTSFFNRTKQRHKHRRNNWTLNLVMTITSLSKPTNLRYPNNYQKTQRFCDQRHVQRKPHKTVISVGLTLYLRTLCILIVVIHKLLMHWDSIEVKRYYNICSFLPQRTSHC
jgi:hypothetical protein